MVKCGDKRGRYHKKRHYNLPSMARPAETSDAKYKAPKALYKVGFSTHINGATPREIDNVLAYAVQLISQRLQIKDTLITLIDNIDKYGDSGIHENRVNAEITEYGVYVGVYKIGKLRVLIQRDKLTSSITLVFKQRCTLKDYKSYKGKQEYQKLREKYVDKNPTTTKYRLNKIKER